MSILSLFPPSENCATYQGEPPHLRLIVDSFAGGGGASTGIEMALGRSPDIAINHNPAALALHEANHPQTLHLSENVYKVDPLDHLRGRHVGLMWFSPDCFPSGTMILTDRGYRPIETIQEGDRVLTHAGRYRRVYATMRSEKAVRNIDVQGVPTITVSDEHPFYARAMHNVWDNANRRYQRTLAPAAWVLAKDLRTGAAPMNAAGGDRHFCATPCSFEHIAIPEVGGRGIAIDERLMWLAGRYVANGWTRLSINRAELVLVCGKHIADDLASELSSWPKTGDRAAAGELTWHRRDTATAHQFSTNNRGLVEWLRNEFGHGSSEKSFPAWVFSAPEAYRRALLRGYASGNGSKVDTGANIVTETVTVSKALALSTKALVESLGYTATVAQPRKNPLSIEGRTATTRPSYLVRWREVASRSQTVRDHLHNWSRVQRVGEPTEVVQVFNISVEEDETYVADGIVVHNCKHFSKAKGGKPVERNIRDLAWIIPGWIERIQQSGGKVDVVAMENVEEWKDWGPLVETERGLYPCPDRKGQTFKQWCKAIKKLGGKIEWRELRACDFGAPTIRKRLFVIIRFDGEPIVWPEPSHGAPTDPDVISGKKLPWRTAAECIDWSLPCPSIFDTSAQIWEKHGLRAVRPLADNTLARVARGMKRYVLDAERPFIVNLTHGARLEDLDQPFNTITGANRGEKAIVSPSLISVAHGDSGGRREYPLDDPYGVVTAGGVSHAVIAPSIQRFNTGATGSGADEPMPTVTANSFIKRPGGAAPLGVLAPHLMTMRNAGKPFNGADEPAHTITAGGAGLSLVAPVLSYAQQGGGNRSVEDPHHTICASPKDQNSVIVPTLVGCGGRAGQSRPRAGDEPAATITAKADSCVATAFIAQHNNDSRRIGGVNPGRPADEPLSTVTATGAQQRAVAAFIARQFGTSTGHAIDSPSATVMADGAGKSQLVAPFLQAYYGTGDGGEEDQPARTITTKDRHGHVEAALDAPPFTEAQAGRAREVADFLRAQGFWDEREFATIQIGGSTFVIVDIGMRMLTPRELYNAQGFPPDYEIERAPDGTVFPKSVQVSCVGNSVSPPVARALIAANCGHMAVFREAAE
ncbi:DNA cytosine methyltransferase [Gellertiella hungarica]|uniref:DNA (cytosine-5-)-methyltransferase n=1 Tax=Gellertiella hungarica TaxID=1572859 RepID=A0A7W6J412_9HYPH|nr:DNA cytosine methyltransferase [Gellertiella hungarica]MBB4063662.1 site-specific DNA-cytosine methylase [Gellertiella hungarica]